MVRAIGPGGVYGLRFRDHAGLSPPLPSRTAPSWPLAIRPSAGRSVPPCGFEEDGGCCFERGRSESVASRSRQDPGPLSHPIASPQITQSAIPRDREEYRTFVRSRSFGRVNCSPNVTRSFSRRQSTPMRSSMRTDDLPKMRDHSRHRQLAIGFCCSALLFAACGTGSEATNNTLPPIQTSAPTTAPPSTSTPTTAAAETTTAPPTTDASRTSSTDTETAVTAPPPSTEPCQAAAEPIGGIEYQVNNVADDDVLNIREFPGHTTAKVGALSPHTSGLRPTGECRMVGTGVWWELDTGDGAWINSKFLTPSS